MAKTGFLKKYFILVIVFLLAYAVRVYRINELPYELDGDEAAFGYYSYTLVHNLSDEYGNRLPLYFPSIGDYKYPGYSYLSAPIIGVLNLSILSTRFLSVLAGSLLCIVVYFLIIEITKSKSAAIIASILMSFSPYAIIFSRGAYESNLATFCTALGILFVFTYIKKKKPGILLYAFLAFLVAIYTYSAARIFIIIIIPVILLTLVREVGVKYRKALFLFSILTIFVIMFSFIDPRSRVRANDIGFTKDPNPVKYLETSIHDDGLAWQGSNLFLTRFFHNKYSAFTLNFIRRYMEHLSPTYLFLESNPGMPKYSAPNIGLFYSFEFLTIVLGIYAFAKFKTKYKPVIFSWVLAGPIPSALTIETPNPIRMLITLPALIILSSLGLWFIYNKLGKRKLFLVLFVVFMICNFMYFWHQYSIHRLYNQPWYSDGGTEEMVKSVDELSERFDKVAISGDPYIFFLYYNKILPQEFLTNTSIEPEVLGKWERVDSFGKIIFKMPMNCPKIGREGVLYVCKGQEIPINSELLKLIRFKDGTPAFSLIKFIPYSQRTNSKLPDGLNYMVETDLSFHEGLLSKDSGRYW